MTDNDAPGDASPNPVPEAAAGDSTASGEPRTEPPKPPKPRKPLWPEPVLKFVPVDEGGS